MTTMTMTRMSEILVCDGYLHGAFRFCCICIAQGLGLLHQHLACFTADAKGLSLNVPSSGCVR